MCPQELRELQTEVKDTSVVVAMNNTRTLDMDAVVAEARAQFDEISKKSLAEAELWQNQKVRH